MQPRQRRAAGLCYLTVAGAIAPGASLCELRPFELLRFRAALERRNRGVAAAHRLSHIVEIARADFALMFRCRVALVLGGEFRLLERDVRAHLLRLVAPGELEHRVVERMEARERDELEPVAHGGELALELRDRRVIE